MKPLVIWEMRRLSRDRNFLAACLVLALLGLVATIYGVVTVQRQNALVARLDQLVADGDNAYFQARFEEDEEFGRAAYYLGRAVPHEARPEAALSLGQRDLHSYHQVVRLRSLYANLFDGSFENPLSQVAGHFDLAFVLVFVLPLLVIVVGFDLLSKEIEGRTLPLLRSSGVLVSHLLLIRLGLRMTTLAFIATLVIVTSGIVVGAGWEILFGWILLTWFYLAFWSAVVALVVSRAWSSARSAITLLTLWVVLTLVGPSVLNLTLPKESTQSGARLTISARQKVNTGWDIPKEVTRRAAVAADPLYRTAPEFGEEFSWAWYYAMHDAGDASVSQEAERYLSALGRREERALSWSVLLPPVRMQLLLEQLAGTDLKSHLEYLRYVKESRDEMRRKFLPWALSGHKLSKSELLRLHEGPSWKSFHPKTQLRSVASYGWQIAVLTFILAAGAWFAIQAVESRLRKEQMRP